MISMVKDINENNNSWHSNTAENFLETFTSLFMVDGNPSNGTHPLAYEAGGRCPDPNILNNDAAMKAVYSENFKSAMAEELDKI